ncbi:cytochrome b [Neorickettsia sennetsu]|uniref:Cytochrome b561 family protein n=1 Tax=Ehrlichia sennetsu (strain ATCC VR-367 / Miyayama) TaxID=222891 RepID=Q2GCK0_EHRS3|nr:cytochrome b [Neorickettsia sennetsu]ABD46265.1 cytochrome b561 family protein [Neorickettsia sennetsu str. Miyayama]
MPSPEKYNLTLRILHWILAFAVIAMLVSGFTMSSYLTPPLKFIVYGKHKAIGMTVGVLMIIRLAIRVCFNIPETQFSRLENIVLGVVHSLLYVLTIGAVFSGYLMSCSAGKPVSWFGIFEFPSLFQQNPDIAKIAHDAHQVIIYLLACLVVLHILATLKHLIIDKENIFKRIF